MKTQLIESMRRGQHGAMSAKAIAMLVLVLVPLLVVGFYEGRKAYWDAQVRELCAKDGGIKVYETVKLPADQFDRWHAPNFYHPTMGENTLGNDYVYKSESTYLHEGTPYLRNHHVQILRRSDMKCLGEVTTYVRGGGDLPGPWQPTEYRCPSGAEVNAVVLMTRIFSESKGN